MANGFIGIDEPATIDKKADTEELTVGANTVHRERIQVTGAAATEIAPVSATDGLKVNLGVDNDVTVTGSVTANAGTNLNTSTLSLEATQASVKTAVELIDDAVYAEDVAAAAANKGISILAVRRDADTSLVDADNDHVQLQVNNLGALKVEIFDGGDSHTVDGAVTANAGTNLNTSLLGLETTQTSIKTAVETIDNFISGARGLVTEDNSAAIKTSVELVDDTIKVLGTDLYTEATTKGILIGAIRRDADTTLVDTTNEVAPLQLDVNGRLKVEVFSGETLPISGTVTANLAAGVNNIGDVDVLSLPAIPAGTNNIGDVDVLTLPALVAGTANIGDVDVLTLPALVAGTANIGDVDILTIAAGDNNIGNMDIVTMPNVTLAAGTNTNEIVGDVAHDIPITGNPITIGGVASAAAPTDVSADQNAVRAWFLRNGAQASVITAAGALIGGDAANGLDVDVTRLPTLANVTTVATVTNLSQQGGVAISLNTGVRDTGTQRVTIATNDVVPVSDNAGSLTVDAPIGTPVNVQIGNATLAAGVIDETGASAVDALAVGGGTAHDAVDSGNPIKVGAKAVSHGSNPTAVAAADRTNLIANIAGIPFSIGGHPNIVSAEYNTTGAITDDNILPAISAGTIYVITSISVMASNANTVNTSFRIGFGATTLTASGATNADAVTKIILTHPNLAAGSGIVKGNGAGIVGIGGDGEELRITCSAPTTGSLFVQVDYFTITS